MTKSEAKSLYETACRLEMETDDLNDQIRTALKECDGETRGDLAYACTRAVEEIARARRRLQKLASRD